MIPPYLFDTGLPKRKILAVSDSEEDLEVARKYQADISGGKQLIRQVRKLWAAVLLLQVQVHQSKAPTATLNPDTKRYL